MTSDLVLPLAALAASVPRTATLLRHGRQKRHQGLGRRVAESEIVAGVPANWLDTSDRLMWSGYLILMPGGALQWGSLTEPR